MVLLKGNVVLTHNQLAHVMCESIKWYAVAFEWFSTLCSTVATFEAWSIETLEFM